MQTGVRLRAERQEHRHMVRQGAMALRLLLRVGPDGDVDHRRRWGAEVKAVELRHVSLAGAVRLQGLSAECVPRLMNLKHAVQCAKTVRPLSWREHLDPASCGQQRRRVVDAVEVPVPTEDQ